MRKRTASRNRKSSFSIAEVYVRGRLVFLPQDNLNTDGIYGKEYTYRDDVTREMMAQVVMQNYDPRFTEQARVGDVVIVEGTMAKDGSKQANARSVTMASTGKKLGAASSQNDSQ